MIAAPCREPGCPAAAMDRGYCADHAQPARRLRYLSYDRSRGTSSQRGYDARWRRIRKLVLAERPLCVDCDRAGRVTMANEVHHIDYNSRNNNPANLMPLCKSCHSRRTAEGR